jgi:PAS domain S-box-containing protein
MNTARLTGAKQKNGARLFGAALGVLFLAAVFSWWTVVRADRQLRDELLLQARLVSQIVDMEQVKNFSGTEADLEDPYYRRLKEQFAELQQVNDKCRFVYLLGRKTTGELFFYLDNEPEDSTNHSPPGEIYHEASAELGAAFSQGRPIVEGPLPDTWGVWVSALVPLADPRSGTSMALLGLDIDARDWNRQLAARAALPVSLILILLVLTSLGLMLLHSRANVAHSRDRARRQRSAIAELALHPVVIAGDLEKACTIICKVSAEVMAVDHVSVWLLTNHGRQLQCFTVFEAGTVKDCQDQVVGVETGADYLIADPSHTVFQDKAAHLTAPILINGEKTGVMRFTDFKRERKWHTDEESFAHTTAAMVVQVISQAERVELLAALQGSEEQFRELFEGAPVGIFQTTPEGRYQVVNPEYARLLGYDSPEEMISEIADIAGEIYVRPEDRARYVEQLRRYGRVINYEVEMKRRDGSPFWVSMNTTVREDKGGVFTGFLTDITERKVAEGEREALQMQLTQAKKMESIGRLAGGVAHDFNNMLAVILGYSELTLKRLDPEEPLCANIWQIQRAAQRSADLTRQLLAFARKQTVAPQLLNLNRTVEGMLDMLRRLIGENIDLDWHPGTSSLTVKIDPSQIDQLIINLAINARDAITDTGKITIETGVATLEEDFPTVRTGHNMGEYVFLTIGDTGCGMDQTTRANLFEPFFTTKEQGKGTGMGLATVYGIVQQNGGIIHVDTSPGEGTTFKIYLPRVANCRELPEELPLLSSPLLPGTETILIVEDEPMLLEMVTGILARQGYAVLPANSPAQALALGREYSSQVDLLLTDVVMPEMNGRDLAAQLHEISPQLRCLYMSGYTADVIACHGVLEKALDFIQKPFSPEELAAKVRAILDQGLPVAPPRRRLVPALAPD